MKLTPAEIVKSVMSEQYVRDRFVSTDWSDYSNCPDRYESDYKVMNRRGSVTVKIGGGYNRFSEDSIKEIVLFLKDKFKSIENVSDVRFMVSENYAGTKYDWLKVKLFRK